MILFLGILVTGLKKWSAYNLLLVLWLAIPPIMTLTIFSRFPMYMDRYLIVSLPAVLVLIAQGIANFRSRMVMQIVGFFVIASMLFGVFQVLFNNTIYEREDWRGAGKYLEELKFSSTENLFIYHWENVVPLLFYYQGNAQIQPIFGKPRVNLPPEIEIIQEKVWLIIPNENDSSHLYGYCDPYSEEFGYIGLAEWRERNSGNLVAVKHFECIRIEMYQLPNIQFAKLFQS